MRHISMRKYPLVLGVLLFLPVSACGDAAAPAPSGSAASPAATVSATAPPESAGATMPATTPPSGTPRPDPSPGGSLGDPEYPVDRVGAPIVLTGPVETGGRCVVLTAQGRRWALIGAAVTRLTDGQRVTVRGRPAPVPRGCDAQAGLAVRDVH